MSRIVVIGGEDEPHVDNYASDLQLTGNHVEVFHVMAGQVDEAVEAAYYKEMSDAVHQSDQVHTTMSDMAETYDDPVVRRGANYGVWLIRYAFEATPFTSERSEIGVIK